MTTEPKRLVRNAAKMAANVAMAPVWTAQLLTGAKSFMDNPLLGSPRLNGMGLHAARLRLAHAMAARRRTRLAPLVTAEDRAAFDRDGFIVRRNFLPPDRFRALRDEVAAHRGTVRDMVQGNTVTRRLTLDPATLRTMPALRDLLHDPAWCGLLRYAFSYDAEPLTYVQTILSHAYAGPDDPQCALHADTFHPTVKAWLFLTDVPLEDGPFNYVPGSHRLTPARLDWEYRRSLAMHDEPDRLSRRGSLRIDPAELEALGLPQPHVFAVPANTLVVADTCGFHARGPSTGPSRRVEVWASGRRNPFLPWAGLDPWRIEALGRRRVPFFYGVQDAAARMGLAHRHWRPKHGVSAFDAE